MVNVNQSLPGAGTDTIQLSKLAALMRLLDDASPVVRDAVTRELCALGGALPDALRRLSAAPTAGEWRLLRALTGEQNRARLSGWGDWRDAPDDGARLERALESLARFLGWPEARAGLGARLDALAGDFLLSGRLPTPSALAAFLAEDRRWRPVANDRAEAPHADACRILETGEGVPALLAALFQLAGARLGLEVTWCGWTGHTAMTRFREDGGAMIVDWKSSAHALELSEFLRMQGPSADAAERMLGAVLTVEEALHLVLVATAQALSHSQEYEDALAVIALAQDLKTDVLSPETPPF